MNKLKLMIFNKNKMNIFFKLFQANFTFKIIFRKYLAKNNYDII